MNIAEDIVFTDENGNKAALKYWGSKEAAIKSLKTLAYCKNCVNCEHCAHCHNCEYCRFCRNCLSRKSCKFVVL